MNRNTLHNALKVTLIIALAVSMMAVPMLGAGVAVADDHNGNETTTENGENGVETENETGDQTERERQAELEIFQERHISSDVDIESGEDTRVYVANGRYLEIKPANFNIDDVTAFDVQESEARLTYDSDINRFVLDTQQNPGTYHLRFTVSSDGDTAIYRAVIRVEQAEYAHLPQSELDELREENEEASALLSRLEGAGDPDQPVGEKVDFAVNVIEFAHAPFAALRSQFMGLQTMRFMTPAGWLDLGMTVVIVYVLTRGLYATIARLRKQLEREEQVSRREDVQYMKMYKQVLSGKQITDVNAIDDHQAAVLEDRLGTNLFTAVRNFWGTWGADSLKRMYADAMGAAGYSIRVNRDSAGEITDLDVLDPDDRSPMADGGEDVDGESGNEPEPPEGDVFNLSNAPTDVVDAMDWDDVDDRVFTENPDISAVDHLMVANRDRPGDLISELNISIPEDFQSRKEFMEAIGHFIAEIQETDFTDEENIPREDRAVLNHVFAFCTVMEQEYNIPMDLYWRAAVWNAEGLSRDDEAQSVLDDITDADDLVDEFGGDSVGS